MSKNQFVSMFAVASDCFFDEGTDAATSGATLIDLLLVACNVQDLIKGQPMRSSMRVAVIAGSIAKRMELPTRQVHAIVQAACVYDLGLAKIAAGVSACLSNGFSVSKFPDEIPNSALENPAENQKKAGGENLSAHQARPEKPFRNEKDIFAIHALLNPTLINDDVITAQKTFPAQARPAQTGEDFGLSTGEIILKASKRGAEFQKVIDEALNALTPLHSPLSGEQPQEDFLLKQTDNKPPSDAVQPSGLFSQGNDPIHDNGNETLFRLLWQHPLAIEGLMDSFSLSADTREIVRAHHERCDGSGYPFGLLQEHIPLGARILALADLVESFLSHQQGAHGGNKTSSKRNSASAEKEKALEDFLTVKAIGRFDPQAIQAFQGLLVEYPDFLKLICGRDVDAMCRHLVSERQTPLSGRQLVSMAEALGELVDQMLPLYFSGHSKKVAVMAGKMAQRLGISKAQQGELVIAALLHDIGMAGVPIEILNKPGALSERDWRVVKEHPYWSGEALRHVPGFSNIFLWVAEHQERMNGRGYPTNRRGGEISIGGRIIALADVYDALTAPRPYRTHVFDPLDALPIIAQGRYSQFDNQLACLLRAVVMDAELAVK